jgi:Ser/Thr protein kinase RdoA (MazF antagonist)
MRNNSRHKSTARPSPTVASEITGWLPATFQPKISAVIADEAGLVRQLASRYDLGDVELTQIETSVNDLAVVTCREGQFALKVYHRKRTAEAVRWETDLLRHLYAGGAAVVQPVLGADADLQFLTLDEETRAAVLFTWAPGHKPAPSYRTYLSLGEAAARIHLAAEGFPGSPARERFDSTVLVDEQLDRMKPLLLRASVWGTATALGERLKSILDNATLDWGICHMDLTLDNVHQAENGALTVFDFDSAGESWRALEPWGVMRLSPAYLDAWLAGYRTVRPFSQSDETGVAAFGIIGDLRVAAWKLGVATSSRGVPLMQVRDLPALVDSWLDWEATHLTP